MSRLWEETVRVLLKGSDGKSVAMIHNFKWKRTPLRVLLRGNHDLTVAPARNLLAATKLHLMHLGKLLTWCQAWPCLLLPGQIQLERELPGKSGLAHLHICK
jgi:hypothetical protein